MPSSITLRPSSFFRDILAKHGPFLLALSFIVAILKIKFVKDTHSSFPHDHNYQPTHDLDKMVDNSVIVLVCIFGSGVGVLMAYAIAHRFYSGAASSGRAGDLEGSGREFSQAAYMREVRIRNYEAIAAVTGVRGKARAHVESMSDRSG